MLLQKWLKYFEENGGKCDQKKSYLSNLYFWISILDRDLHPESLDRSWNQLMMAYKERDQMIHEEIARLEKLQKLAEKVHQEAKVTDSKLDDIEAWIEEEAKRVDHLHPKDAKNNCDQIERELQRIDEEVIKQMFNDVKILRDNRYSQANELHRRYSVK